MIIPDFSLKHLRFQLEPKAPLHMPACLPEHMPAYNNGNVIQVGLGARFDGLCVRGIGIRR